MSRMRIGSKDILQAQIFEILLENFPDIIHSVDECGRIVFTNRKAEALLGYTRDELLSMNVRQIYADEVLKAVDDGFRELKKTGDFSVESVLKARDGTRIPVEIRSFCIYDDNGVFLRTFSILRDIRPIKELQNRLVHAARLAAIGEVASGVAHDINNPLTVILLANELAAKDVAQTPKETIDAKLADRLRSLSGDINRASRSIEKLVTHLRNFARGVAEKAETVDLLSTVSDALFITKNRIVGTHTASEVVTPLGPCPVSGRPNQLEQVFVNLISNACDAMAKSETRRLTVRIGPTTVKDAAFWKCEVIDTGTGIPPELLEEVFQSYFTTKEKGKGTGLGLSIARGIVKEHSGEIFVASELGKGTTFSVLLPSAPPENALAPHVGQTPHLLIGGNGTFQQRR